MGAHHLAVPPQSMRSDHILYGTKSDDKGPNIPLILEVDYLTQDHLTQAMSSPARFESRDLLPGFYEAYFDDVVLRHYIYKLS